MLRVLIFTCRQSGQRMNYYNALGKLCDLTVVAERRTPDDILEAYNVRPENYKVIYMRGIPMFGYMALCPGVLNVLKGHKEYDVIIVEQYSTPTAAIAINYLSRHKIPFVISADSGFANGGERSYKRRVKAALISKASLWITGGKASVDYLAYYGANPARTRIFKFSPYSREDQPEKQTSDEERNAVKKELGIKETKVIVSVGQQIHRKGFDVLLKAMQRLKYVDESVGLYILGGAPNEECQTILDNMDGSNIHFPGLVSKDTLKKYYKASNIFVFPTRYDIWGYPVNEAMSFGLPVITTYQCNAGLELLEEGVNGYLVEADDIAALTDRMQELLNDAQKCAEMGKANYLKSKEYNSEKMAESVYGIISEFSKEISAGTAGKK